MRSEILKEFTKKIIKCKIKVNKYKLTFSLISLVHLSLEYVVVLLKMILSTGFRTIMFFYQFYEFIEILSNDSEKEFQELS